MKTYDVIVIGTGPGGYVSAIRASQLGLRTAVVERESLGGICLNWGCIPTKALLRSAQVYATARRSADYGIDTKEVSVNFSAVVARSRKIAGDMEKGVVFLLKKNKVDVLHGFGSVPAAGTVLVNEANGKSARYGAKHIILATGARSRDFDSLRIDKKKIIGYREAMTLKEQPKRLLIVGSGAIGIEFAYFYHTLGTQVTVVELLDRILPAEDKEVSIYMQRHYEKAGIRILTSAEVKAVDTKGVSCRAEVLVGGKTEKITVDKVLLATGITANLEHVGLEALGVTIEHGKVKVDDFYRTNCAGLYAIGDMVSGPALAHVASAEGVVCVEKIAGMAVEPIHYNNIPACTYCDPEVASVGYTEEAALAAGYKVKVGRFPFTVSGKAKASGEPLGFVKVIYDARYGEWLGTHMVGAHVTEMIAEAVVGRKLETTHTEIIKAIHPHPTFSEAVMEASAAAYDEAIHL